MIFNTIFILVCFYLGFKAGNYMISKKKQMIITPKDRFCKKAYQLSKVVKPVIGCKWHKLYNQEQKDILLDICYMPEDLIEFLLIDKFTCQEDYLGSIDIFFILECKTFDYKSPLKYEIGNMKLITKQMYLQHDYLDLRLKLGIN